MPAGGESVIGDQGAFEAAVDRTPDPLLAAAMADGSHALAIEDRETEIRPGETAQDAEIKNAILARFAQISGVRPVTTGALMMLSAAVTEAAAREAALQARLDAVLAVCDAGEHQAIRWEQPYPVPAWVTDVRAATEGRDSDAQ